MKVVWLTLRGWMMDEEGFVGWYLQ